MKPQPYHKYVVQVKSTGVVLDVYFANTKFFDQHYNSYEVDDVEIIREIERPWKENSSVMCSAPSCPRANSGAELFWSYQ